MRPQPRQDQPRLRASDLRVADGGAGDPPGQEACPHHGHAGGHQGEDPEHPGRCGGRQVREEIIWLVTVQI